MSTTRGVVFIHSAAAALCPHVEWAIAGVLDASVNLRWQPQPVEPGSLRAEYLWTGASGTAGALTTALRNCQRLRFEVTEDPAQGQEGQRFSFTPSLGLFRATTGPSGDIVAPEERIRAALAADLSGARTLVDGMHDLIGTDWDEELEVFRYAGEGQTVRWLHVAV